jgi:hypothetical protein
MFDGDTVDRTIRNHAYHPWPVIVGGLLFFFFWAAACVSGGWKLSINGLVLLVALLLCFFQLFVFGLLLLKLRPVERIKLGDDIQVWPGSKRYAPDVIKQISFEPDPKEDYRDLALPIRHREVRIDLRPRGSFRLLVSIGDAQRIREWAVTKGAAVVGHLGDPSSRREA